MHSRSLKKINYLMYIDDIKLFTKNEKKLETQIYAVRIYSQIIWMEFGIETISMLVMKCGKRPLTIGRELPNHENIRTLGEKETYKYLGILEADTIKKWWWKKKIRKNISGELESYLRQDYLAKTLSKE